MKNNWKLMATALMLVGAVTMVSCGEETPPTEPPVNDAGASHENHGDGATTDGGTETSDAALNLSTEQVDELKSAYFGIKNALVETDGASTANAGKTFVDAIASMPEGKLKDKLKLDAEHIRDTEDVAHQRDHFKTLSENMYALLSQVKGSAPVYQQYCPMAFDNTGANWLSSEEAIRNPYFGDMMLTCGKVTETIE